MGPAAAVGVLLVHCSNLVFRLLCADKLQILPAARYVVDYCSYLIIPLPTELQSGGIINRVTSSTPLTSQHKTKGVPVFDVVHFTSLPAQKKSCVGTVKKIAVVVSRGSTKGGSPRLNIGVCLGNRLESTSAFSSPQLPFFWPPVPLGRQRSPS